MGLWAEEYIERLREGKNVVMRPTGNSMIPLIRSGQRCVIVSANDREIAKGDIVLCKVKGNHYLHKVLAVADGRYLIGNNHGGQNGWTGRENIYGIYAADGGR